MTIIETDNGDIIHDCDSIVKEVKHYYENLYSSREERLLHDDFDDIVFPSLSEEEREGIEGLISLDEVLHALKGMKNDKSPGSDGFISEFFKFFFQDLGDFIVRSINFGFEKGEMSVIRDIPKEGKDKSRLKNWRPISLLNTVYKIASCCIAEIIKTVIDKLIHEDQKGFLKGRYIGENIRLVYDTLLFAEKNHIPGLLLQADLEKAFDSVSWAFIDKCLSFFNFGNDIKRWISAFYTNIASCVSVNGKYSQWFKIYRGTRQGDPLSLLIFFCYVRRSWRY